MFQILVVEDDAQLQQLFCRVLSRNGYTPIPAGDGQEALEKLEHEHVDLIISDIMMPRLNGYQLVSALREAGISIPVLMITARDSFDDMRQGFLSGSDDYMVKPVNVNEMVLRVQALLRRAQMVSERRVTLGGTVLDLGSFSVSRGSAQIVLPQKEFLLLYKLASYPGHIFTRQQLMDEIWGLDSETESRTVDVHINRLRDHFRDDPDFRIVTIRGVGYKLVRNHE